MSPRIAEVLDHAVLTQVLNEDAPVESIVENLFLKGNDLSDAVKKRHFSNWEQFKQAHATGDSELAELEGESDIDQHDRVSLKKCPLSEIMSKFVIDGQFPDHFKKIVEDFKHQNPGSNAILHPGCIAHQVARQLIVKDLDIENEKSINYFQFACRDAHSGKVVFDDQGLENSGASWTEAAISIDGNACYYKLIK
jgi:hypothetical protein